LHQLRARFKGKTLAIILDNASIHKAKVTNKFIEKYTDIKLYYLPTYSPKYNPTEQVWKWLKPLVHAAKTINGGIKELLSRTRKIMYARANGKLVEPSKIGIGIWDSLL
jgi:putative transposase